MTLNEHIAFVADLEDRDQLVLLDEVSYRHQRSDMWLFGLTSGLYFANALTRQKREPVLRLGECYYDTVEGRRTNRLADAKRSCPLSSRDDIRHGFLLKLPRRHGYGGGCRCPEHLRRPGMFRP